MELCSYFYESEIYHVCMCTYRILASSLSDASVLCVGLLLLLVSPACLFLSDSSILLYHTFFWYNVLLFFLVMWKPLSWQNLVHFPFGEKLAATEWHYPTCQMIPNIAEMSTYTCSTQDFGIFFLTWRPGLIPLYIMVVCNCPCICPDIDDRLLACMLHSVQFHWPIWSLGGHERIQQRSSSGLLCMRPFCAVLAWAKMSFFDVVHQAFPLPTTASPTLQGALKYGFGEAVLVCDMPKPCKFPSLDSCQERFLWTHKGSWLCSAPSRWAIRHLVSKIWILFSESASRVHVSLP